MGLDISSCKHHWVVADASGHFTCCVGFCSCGQALSLGKRYSHWCFSVGLDIFSNLKLGRVENEFKMIPLKTFRSKIKKARPKFSRAFTVRCN